MAERIVPDGHMDCRSTSLDSWLAKVCYGVTGGTLTTDPLTFAGHSHYERLGEEWVARATQMWRYGKSVRQAVRELEAAS